jgi:hypothetical protein
MKLSFDFDFSNVKVVSISKKISVFFFKFPILKLVKVSFQLSSKIQSITKISAKKSICSFKEKQITQNFDIVKLKQTTN